MQGFENFFAYCLYYLILKRKIFIFNNSDIFETIFIHNHNTVSNLTLAV